MRYGKVLLMSYLPPETASIKCNTVRQYKDKYALLPRPKITTKYKCVGKG